MDNFAQLKNRHPADELADVRAEIKVLQTREQQLRERLLAAPTDRQGSEWNVVIKQQQQNGYDVAEIKRHFGIDALARFRSSKLTTYVKLVRRK